MTEDRRSRVEIDIGAALNDVEAATFEADELLRCVLASPDKRLDARDTAGLLHHCLNAMRLVSHAFERRHEWPDLSGDTLKVVLGKRARDDANEALNGSWRHLEQCRLIFGSGAAQDDPAHWSMIDRAKYAGLEKRVNSALEKIKLAIESLTHGD